MTDLDQMNALQREISAARGCLQAKEALFQELLTEIPWESAKFNALLARYGLLAAKLNQPAPQSHPTYYDSVPHPPGSMGDRGPEPK